jgi:hypothetical protein
MAPKGLILKTPYHSHCSSKITLRASKALLRDRIAHVGFVVDKVVLGQVFSKYFGFPC